MKKQRLCLNCKKELLGRVDKKFCDVHCKSAHHYKLRQENMSFYSEVDQQLKLNRKILKVFNKAGKATVRSEVLLEQGFNPDFFTHYWKTKKGEVYLFVYEYGFLKKNESGKRKFILVEWQPYMSQK